MILMSYTKFITWHPKNSQRIKINLKLNLLPFRIPSVVQQQVLDMGGPGSLK